MIRTILVPLDGSPVAENALPLAGELARALPAKVVLACVAGPDFHLGHTLNAQDRQAIAEAYTGVTEEDHLLSTDPRITERAQGQVRVVAEAESYLKGIAGKLQAEGCEAEQAIAYGDAVEGILTEISLHSVDLVVMTTHGHTGIRRFLGGSVAQGVLSRSPVPVMLVPCPAE